MTTKPLKIAKKADISQDTLRRVLTKGKNDKIKVAGDGTIKQVPLYLALKHKANKGPGNRD